jgi:signal peptidase I
MIGRMLGILKEYKALLLFAVLISVFRSAVADWNDVPTGSMLPTIQEGDRILVNKLAYDVRLPFTHVSLVRIADPVRGDIVVFDSERAGTKLVKRIIGLPGDVVAMQSNILFINGQRATYALPYLGEKTGTTDLYEEIVDIRHPVRFSSRPNTPLSSFGPVRVPDGYYLVLGDNRDNSADSRVYGYIPRAEFVGRSSRVAFSLDYDRYFAPRGDRFLHELK